MNLRPYKKIKELEYEIERLKRQNECYSELESKRIEREKSGMHSASYLCTGCKYLINTYLGSYSCKKDCKCKDREEE